VHAAGRREQLQRDALAELEVVGAVDLTGGAAAQQADDAVAGGEDVAGWKPRILEGVDVGGAGRGRTVEAGDG